MGEDPDRPRRVQQLARGLRYLAPWIAREHGAKFWSLVGEGVQASDDLGRPMSAIAEVAQRDAWADLRSTLGEDPRFDAARWHLPKDRFQGHDVQTEPIPGFVRVPKGAFRIGMQGEDDNPPRQADVLNDYYIARYLTTVDQYAAFMEGGGYSDKEQWWDSQGLAWRESNWASKTEDKALRDWLDSRTVEQRQQPMRWTEQRAHGSRAVWGINWFEARAYARWLQAQLQTELKSAKLATYQVHLPTEIQWERAARAADLQSVDDRRWPWAGDDKLAHLRGNIDDSKIGRASVVGLFEPNPIGLYDLAGNVWEWQDNLYQDKGRYKAGQRIDRLVSPADGPQSDWLVTDKEWKNSALPALRGGLWGNTADYARASIRFGFLPDYWFFYVGFRLVLSLANLKSET
ncbi:MAG: formylglycine-generating enzyme family protein, partial [Rhodoferax sp.]|nr:formylglycine-generating enzyme family protein [Rhodoferax sp.]